MSNESPDTHWDVLNLKECVRSVNVSYAYVKNNKRLGS